MRTLDEIAADIRKALAEYDAARATDKALHTAAEINRLAMYNVGERIQKLDDELMTAARTWKR